MPDNIQYENYENRRENNVENVQLIDLNNIVMSKNIHNPNNDDMKIKEDEIDETMRKEWKRKNKFACENLREKNKLQIFRQ